MPLQQNLALFADAKCQNNYLFSKKKPLCSPAKIMVLKIGRLYYKPYLSLFSRLKITTIVFTIILK